MPKTRCEQYDVTVGSWGSPRTLTVLEDKLILEVTLFTHPASCDTCRRRYHEVREVLTARGIAFHFGWDGGSRCVAVPAPPEGTDPLAYLSDLLGMRVARKYYPYR